MSQNSPPINTDEHRCFDESPAQSAKNPFSICVHLWLKKEFQYTLVCTVAARFEARLIESNGAPSQLIFTVIKGDEKCSTDFLTRRIPIWVEALPILEPGEKFASTPAEIIGIWKGNVEGEPGF